MFLQEFQRVPKEADTILDIFLVGIYLGVIAHSYCGFCHNMLRGQVCGGKVREGD